jgi:methionyl-tRNA synthetase
MPETLLFTTAIDYTNAAPHIGHAYEKVLTDVVARYHRASGRSVYFLTGVDQHGQKVQQSAEREGLSPKEFAERCTEKFVALWSKLDVAYDGWAATTAPVHIACVQKILQALHDKGQLYKQSYTGFYSIRQEQFLTDKERGEDGQFGPEWGQVVELAEENWYFRLSEHKAWLLGFLDRNPEFVIPAFRNAELRNAVERISGDLCISRPKARLAWGIELPFDRDYVTYVWFDALINYLSFAGYLADGAEGLPEFERVWPAAAQVIGKDILVPAHGVYWTVMQHAMGFSDEQIPRLLVHGWWNIAGAKMSKSVGNIVDPNGLCDRYGSDALRYYLMADIATGRDADFSEDRLRMRFNEELANNVGNLLNRSLNMTNRFRAGVLRAGGSGVGAHWEALARLSGEDAPRCIEAYRAAMEGYQVDAALREVVQFARACNQLIESSAPWKLAKDPAEAELLDAVLWHLVESVRIIGALLAPVLPRTVPAIFAQLQIGQPGLADLCWGGIPDGHTVGSPTPVFPRLEAPKVEEDPA